MLPHLLPVFNDLSSAVDRPFDAMPEVMPPPPLRPILPPGVEIEVVYDRADFVGRTLSTVATNLLEGALLETHYDWCAEQHGAQPAGHRLCARNTVSYTDAGYSGIHCLGNATTIPAISLHVYGVDETQIATAVNHLLPVLAA